MKKKEIMQYFKFFGMLSIGITALWITYIFVAPLYKEFNNKTKGAGTIILWIFGYFFLRSFIQLFDKWKYYPILFKIIDFPFSFHSLILKPYYKMFMAVLLIGSVTLLFSLLCVKIIPEKVFKIDLKYDVNAYMTITLSTILFRSFGNFLIKNFSKPTYKPDNSHEHVELTLSLVNEERIRYIIYFLFFVALLFIPFFKLAKMNIIDDGLSLAVTSSFATFIAYDRLLNNWSLFKFDPKKHKKLLLKVYEKDTKYQGMDNFLVPKKEIDSNSVDDEHKPFF